MITRDFLDEWSVNTMRMTDEQVFELAEKIGFQDDFGRWNFTSENLLDFVFMVQKAEREACVKVCDELLEHTKKLGNNDAMLTAISCAVAILARGEK